MAPRVPWLVEADLATAGNPADFALVSYFCPPLDNHALSFV